MTELPGSDLSPDSIANELKFHLEKQEAVCAALEDIADTYYTSKEFVYITHRVNSYAVDPAVYTKTSQIKNLVGFAVVASNYIALSNAEIEKIFLKKPFEIFTELDKAKEWAQSLVKTK